jgi:hypothetical protein
MQAATSEAMAWVARRETSQREYDETYLAAAVAGAMLLSVTAAGAAIRKHESSFAERPAVSGPIVSDCTAATATRPTASETPTVATSPGFRGPISAAAAHTRRLDNFVPATSNPRKKNLGGAISAKPFHQGRQHSLDAHYAD